MIGFDATEDHRVGNGGGTYVTTDKSDDGRYEIVYSLRKWGWDRSRCEKEIHEAGLPVPVKSACFMCGASKKHEIIDLAGDLRQRSHELEANYKNGKHWRGDKSTVVGLGRKFAWGDLA